MSSTRPSVSFIIPTLNSPVMGPVTVLAKNLQAQQVPVQIVGADLGEGVHPMYEGYFDYTAVSTPRIYRYPDYWRECRKIADATTGDIVVAVKAFAQTVPIALWLKKHRGRRAVAYLDEWDGGLWEAMTPAEQRAHRRTHWMHPSSEMYYPRIEKRLPECDLVLSTTRFLQSRFGGDVVPMGVDMDTFSLAPAEVTEPLRSTLGLEGKRVIVFGGVVRPHKGVELILDALDRLRRPDTVLLIVGPRTEHVRYLEEFQAYRPYLRCTDAVPKEQMPKYLSLGDLTVLPLDPGLLSQSQMPCKVFEAMAMGLPVIASEMSDLPEVLSGCGWLVPPGDVGALAAQIAWTLDHPQDARAAGERARQRCAELYSRKATTAQWTEILDRLS